uniref:Integrin subunit alpha 8 n=1 Tax=Naja naja TaxID=35670 RepID=A0A8C6XHJ2_NAJNA
KTPVAVLSLLLLLAGPLSAFNLDEEKLDVYSGPKGSYFGYALDFYSPAPNAVSVLVGAPKANTTQPDIVEGGAVYYCPWPATECKQIPFDNKNNRKIKVNGTRESLEFKSNQWFGATIRTHKEKVVACAPLYHWRTLKAAPEKDPVGTCYVAIQNFTTYAEYSPCRNNNPDPEGQGYCQAGFSLDFYKNGELILGGPGSFYWQGQVITSSIADVIIDYSFKNILRKLLQEKQTGVAPSIYDDNYLGKLYSDFAGTDLLVAGVPRGAQNFGYVCTPNILFHFPYPLYLAISINMDDILVGAPLFMEREFESNPKEVGQVYLYLQDSVLSFKEAQTLSGTEVFGRFGNSIAPLGDLNQDGYRDVAIGAPFAGEDRRGRVFIYNGDRNGLNPNPSQILTGLWASQSMPAGFGFTLRGDSDIDQNDYPDLIVGAFGFGKVVVYRARPVVTINAQLLLSPVIINPENKTCHLPGSMTLVACFTVIACAGFQSPGFSDKIVLKAELQLDSLKTQGAVKRTLFLDYHQSQHVFSFMITTQNWPTCKDFVIYLRDETEFRDKLSPINISLNYKLDESTFSDVLTVSPILNYYQENRMEKQAYILVDCGEDNVCIPDLKLSVMPDRDQIVIGEENYLMLTINSRNEGEGAYETELHIIIPPEADYTGVERSNKALRVLSCDYKMENETRTVICDLGNPMEAGTNRDTSLRAQPGLGDLHNIGPSAINDTVLYVEWPVLSKTEFLLYILHIQTHGPLKCQTSSAINSLEVKFTVPEDTPELAAFLRNSSIPHSVGRREAKLVEYQKNSAKILNCTNVECLMITCSVGLLEKGKSAALKIRSRLWASTFLQRKNYRYALSISVSFEVKKMPYKVQPAKLPEGSIAIKTSVIWATPNVSFIIPLWVIILAILLGLLVLAMLTLALWKCGFFDRARPPKDDMAEKVHLTSDKTTET